MRILITGIAGFIGSNLADTIPPEYELAGFDNLLRKDESRRNLYEIARPFRFIEGDVRDENGVRDAMYKTDLVFHLAALPSHRLALTKPPLEYVTVDLLGTLNVLDAARETGTKVVFASSNKVYGHQPIPFREDMPKKPEGPYGQAKASSEDYMEQYSKYHGVQSVAVRFHHAVGKRCHSDLVLPMFVEAALKGEPLVANGRENGDGTFEYCAADFTNINDVIRGLSIFLSYDFLSNGGFDVFNFGTGKMTTVCELAQMVLHETKSKSAITRGIAMPHEGLVHLADVSKARAQLGFVAETPLLDSVREYVAWRTAL